MNNTITEQIRNLFNLFVVDMIVSGNFHACLKNNSSWLKSFFEEQEDHMIFDVNKCIKFLDFLRASSSSLEFKINCDLFDIDSHDLFKQTIQLMKYVYLPFDFETLMMKNEKPIQITTLGQFHDLIDNFTIEDFFESLEKAKSSRS